MPVDPDRIAAVLAEVERNTVASGEIETTHHVVWLGGVKLLDRPGYVESPYFPTGSAD